jgi:hypothetical protein
MFGHLKAEDFTNLVEGDELSSRCRTHLKSCTRCSDALESAHSLHAELMRSVIDDQDMPEPDWFQFRADVRTGMLSRAAQRQPKTIRWSTLILRPAVTWGLAVAFTAGLSAGLLIWNRSATLQVLTPGPIVESSDLSGTAQIASLDVNGSGIIPDDISLESTPIDSGLSIWSQTSVFDELSQLTDSQADKLQLLLESNIREDPAKP